MTNLERSFLITWSVAQEVEQSAVLQIVNHHTQKDDGGVGESRFNKLDHDNISQRQRNLLVGRIKNSVRYAGFMERK